MAGEPLLQRLRQLEQENAELRAKVARLSARGVKDTHRTQETDEPQLANSLESINLEREPRDEVHQRRSPPREEVDAKCPIALDCAETLGVQEVTHAPLNMRLFPATRLTLDEFEFEAGAKSLGKGAMGNVQLVRWKTKPGAPFRALKRISKFQMWKEDDPIMLFEQLWDEIESLLKLDHANIVGLDGYFEDYRYVYLVLEYAPYGDLNQKLGDSTRLDESDVVRHIRGLVRALIHCHENQYLHRDVKPENLLISACGDLLLADFGCVATPRSSRKSLCGTRHYHSWEIANDLPHDEASDAWSVGCVCFELLVGKSPFESDDEDEDDDVDYETKSDDGGNDRDEQDESPTESDDEQCHVYVSETEEAAEIHREDVAVEGVHDVASSIDLEEEEEEDTDDEEEEEDDDDDDDDDDDESSEASSEDVAEVEKIYARIRMLEFRYPEYVSATARDFIDQLLHKEKETRMTLQQALQHPFLTEREN